MIALEQSDEGRVVTVTLNRPEKRNALNQRLVSELLGVIQGLSNDESVRVVILTGAGNVFSAGADLEALEEMQSATFEENRDDSQALADLFVALRTCSKPIIARVNGHALAGGFGLVTACDFAVADERAKFGFTEVRIGFVPAIISTLLRSRLHDLTLRNLLLRGHLISSQDAVSLGLINRAVDAARLDDSVMAVADDIIRETSGNAVAETKRLLFELEKRSWSDGVAFAVDTNARIRHSEDCIAGIRAFLNREDPPWKREFDKDE